MSATKAHANSRNLSDVRRIVVKVGSSLLTDPVKGLANEKIAQLCAQLANLQKQGFEVILVSSGAVAEGCARLGWHSRPDNVNDLQAAAAVGQMGLVQAYESELAQYDLHTAMVMLTHDDLANRQRYLNARVTLSKLVGLGVIPIINENDTVATDEIRFGDNDTLAALVANLLVAGLLIIVTDVDGLLDADPKSHPQAKRISQASANDPALDQFPGESVGQLGRGGMVTKLTAARLAARSGAHTVLVSGHQPNSIEAAVAGADVGTLLTADETLMTARKRWIAGQLRAKGDLILDAGASEAVRQRGVSLLAVGLQAVKGEFGRGDVVRLIDPQGRVIGQGLSNYPSVEVAKLKGVNSEQFSQVIGYRGEDELVHRDNLVLLD